MNESDAQMMLTKHLTGHLQLNACLSDIRNCNYSIRQTSPVA